MTDFTTVRSEGGLLPPDLLRRIVGSDAELGGLAPKDYGLAASDRLGEAAARAWARAKAYWAAFRAATQELGASETGVSQTRQQWLRPLLRELGYRDKEEVVADTSYPTSHRSGPVPIHLVSFRQDLDRAAAAGAGQRRMNPHALLQDCLNRSEATYGLVSNGLLLRLLRDNASLTRQAYVEFDLEALFEGGVYADFVLLYLVLHRSRLPREGQEASQCWLEQWRARAEAQGTRALGELRKGVEAAITALGSGFLAHPGNEALRQRLASGQLPVAEYYQQLLRLIYRLIFLFAAEERELVFPPGADPANRRRYRVYYAASRLRDLARKHLADERHDDLWRSLRITFQLLSGDRQGLDVHALGGGLFDAESCPDLDSGLVRNDALAEAVRQLSWVRVGKVTRRVSYRDMDAEELGGVYEGLLERQPQVAADAARPRFELVGSGQRKQTGSYYTPTPLVQELIRSALEPVIGDRLKDARTPEARQRALLGITVCDPACGSGHFLLAAARRLAQELARIEAGEAEPSPEQLRAALRQVIRTCLYGVDVNPLAVDLCKLALWLEGHDPGRPLTFLDHHIKLGNSLVGATWELLAKGVPDEAFEPVTGDEKLVASAVKKRNRQQRAGQQLSLEAAMSSWDAAEAGLAREAERIGALPEDGLGQLREQRAAYEIFDRARLAPARATLDAWTAAFFWPLASGAPDPPTTASLALATPERPPALASTQRNEVERLRRQHHFFHWPLEFPEVFERGGFDCVLGNPPWERIKLQEEEFFAERDPSIATAPNKAARQKLIEALPRSNPALYEALQAGKRAAEGESKLVRESGRFPLTAVGDVNVYALFAEHDRTILNVKGGAGIVVPTGIATDDSYKGYFQDVVGRSSLATLFDFENRKVFFPDIHASYKFCLLTLSGSPVPRGDLAFFLTDVDHLRDERRRFQLGPEDFALLNPNTRTCPVFRTGVDADVARAIYRRVPVLVDERAGSNAWGVKYYPMLHQTNDSGLFVDAGQRRVLPIYESKMFDMYDHRFASVVFRAGNAVRQNQRVEADLAQHQDPSFRPEPVAWIEAEQVDARLTDWPRGWLLAFKDVTSSTNERTLVATILPRVGVVNSGPLLLPNCSDPRLMACLLACLNSLGLDFQARHKVGGLHVNWFILKQFPVLPPSAYMPHDLDFIVPRVLELTYTAWDLQPFAQDLGYDGPPFRWDEERRALLRAELDAYYAALYGLTRDELRYILDPSDVYGPDFPGETFRVLKNNDIRKCGEYRTRRLVLEAWDRLGLEPRNRDGRYPVEPPPGVSTSPPRSQVVAPPPPEGGKEKRDQGPARPARVREPAAPAVARESRAPQAEAAPPLAPDPWPASQPGLPVMPVATQLSLGAAQPGSVSQRRRAHLQRILDLLARDGPLSAAQIAARLTAEGLPLDEKVVRGILYLEGVGQVEQDLRTLKYRVKG